MNFVFFSANNFRHRLTRFQAQIFTMWPIPEHGSTANSKKTKVEQTNIQTKNPRTEDTYVGMDTL
jgi:hypothetical protein